MRVGTRPAGPHPGGRAGAATSLLRAAALAVALLAAAAAAVAQTGLEVREVVTTERLQVTDPYIELHTGPGRGYPVFFVVQRGDHVVVTMRRTDWYKVRTAEGREGWVHRQQLETTITEAGAAKTFRDLVLDDYLRRRVELGAAWGRFESDPMLKVWTAYRLADPLSAEATVGQVQGTFSGSSFWHLNLVVEPWSDRRLSPFLAAGFGSFRNIPNSSLVDATTTNARLANASAGLRYHLSDRFVARADYTLYTAFVSDANSTEYRAWTLGLSFFF